MFLTLGRRTGVTVTGVFLMLAMFNLIYAWYLPAGRSRSVDGGV